MVMLLTPVGIIDQVSVRCIRMINNKLEFLYQKKVDTIFFLKKQLFCMSPSDSQNIKALPVLASFGLCMVHLKQVSPYVN